MIDFVRYDPTSGEILQCGSVPASQLALQGEHVLPCSGDADTHYVDVATKLLIEKPQKPGDSYTWDYAAKQWVFDKVQCLRDIRLRRAALLQASDWTQLPDTPVADKAAWEAYRQALRDVTNQPDLEHIVWPTPPM